MESYGDLQTVNQGRAHTGQARAVEVILRRCLLLQVADADQKTYLRGFYEQGKFRHNYNNIRLLNFEKSKNCFLVRARFVFCE